jgi:hypothetical protein
MLDVLPRYREFVGVVRKCVPGRVFSPISAALSEVLQTARSSSSSCMDATTICTGDKLLMQHEVGRLIRA